MSLIRVHKLGSAEYGKLKFFAEVANRQFLEMRRGFYIDIKDIYFDYGQNWMYTALITERFSDDSTWQSLCPRDYENVVASDSFSEIEAWAIYYATEVANGKISVDLS